jgi:cbb3-type cytochrome c oxidase subunit III
MDFNNGRFGALFIGACLVFATRATLASEESADRQTQTALGMDAHPDKGRAKFVRYCSQCHGLKAQGDAARAAPSLAGQRFAYLVRQIANYGSAERDNAAMYHVVSNKAFSDPQTWSDVASYLNRMTPAADAETGDGVKAVLGRGIFHEQCASCHQNDASGDREGFVPSLRHQRYTYLVNQLHRLADGHRHNVDQSLVLFMRSLDESDMVAVADYLSRLRGTGSPHQRMLSNGVVVD